MFYMQAVMFNMIINLVWGGIVLTYHLLVLIGCSFTVVVCWIWNKVDTALYNYAQNKEKK